MRKEILKSGLSKYGTYWPRKILKDSIKLFERAYIFGPNNYVSSLRNATYKDGAIYADVPDEIAEKELHVDCLAQVRQHGKTRVVRKVEGIFGLLFDEQDWQTEDGRQCIAERRL